MIWLIGNKGMLGTELSRAMDSAGIAYTGSDREVDITDPSALRSFAADKQIDWIINCSAYTAVDKAEDEPDLAHAINATGAGNIALIANEINASMIHISTDYVFRGDGSQPYRETDPVDPAGRYGITKAEGERLVLAQCPASRILRTAWLYGEYGNNFVHTMLKLMSERDELNVVYDQVGSPTWAKDLAGAVLAMIRATAAPGIYHYTNEGVTNWHAFACAIQELGLAYGLLSRPCTVNPVTTDQYPTKTKRPAYSVLSKEKIVSATGIRIPHWRDSLEAFINSKKRN
jgi:dTDP-4-dehydrorhamnose reductase